MFQASNSISLNEKKSLTSGDFELNNNNNNKQNINLYS
jgi:hypothetical protein